MNCLHKIFAPIRLAVLLLLLPVAAMAAEPAGFVLMASGKVFALQSDQALRPLKRKSPFYPGESLKTEANSRAQMRFRDGSLISMRPETEIRIDEFRYQEDEKGEDKNIFTLINGGFRTITGKIGKKDPRNYQMKSAVASIGVRGTTYEVVMDGGLNVAAWQGTIVVENEGGDITLGAEGVFNFAHVGSATLPPSGSMKPPAAIRNEPETKRDNVAGDRKEKSENKPDGRRVEEGAESGNDRGEQVPKKEGGRDPEMKFHPRMDGPIGDGMADKPPLFDKPFIPPEIITTQVFDPAQNGTLDQRTVGVNFDRLAMAVGAGTGFQKMLAGGKAGYDANGKLFITDNGLHPGEAGFDATAYTHVLTRGLAAMSAPASFVIDAGHTVEWGVWQATATAPVYSLTNASDASIYTAIDQPVFWSTVVATPLTAISARTGVVNYRNVLGFIGGGNSGAISNVFMNLSINFDTAAASGVVHIYTPGELWNLNLGGAVMGPTLDFTSFAGNVNGNTVFGEFNSIFTGNNAQAILSSFDLESTVNPNVHVEGLALVTDTNVGDLRLTPTEVSSINRVGIALKSSNLAGMYATTGMANSAASPFFIDKGLLLSDPNFATAPILDVMRQGSAAVLNSFNDPLYPVSWGIWGASGVQMQTNADDPLVKITLSDPVVWMTVKPTSAAVLAGLTGGAYFHSAPGTPATQGLSNYGLGIDWLNADIELDFDTALFKGNLWVETNAYVDDWDIAFDGALDGARLAVTSMNGTYNGAGGSGSAGGKLYMVLTGTTPNAIAGAFDLEYSANPNYYVQGNFMAERDLRLSFADVAAMDRVALAAFDSIGVTDPFIGRSSSGSSGSPIIGKNGFFDLSSKGFWLEESNDVFRKGAAPDLVTSMTDTSYQVATVDPKFEVSWGAWNGQATAFERYTDPINGTVFSAVNQDMYWMTLLPAPIISGTAGGRTGSLTYANPIAILGGGTGGAINGGTFLFSANVNFDTTAITAGSMSFDDAATDTWAANFAGNLNGAQLQIISPTVTYNATGAAGQIHAVLTGPTAEGVGGSFDFDYATGTAAVSGVFLVNCGGC